MGFSTIGGFIIFMWAVMLIVFTIVYVYVNASDTNKLAMDFEREQNFNRAHVVMDILNISYSDSVNPNYVSLLVKNTGGKDLAPDHLDVYFDSSYIPRSKDNRSISFENGSQRFSALLWNPGETIKVNVTIPLAKGSHRVTVSSETGATDSMVFTVA